VNGSASWSRRVTVLVRRLEPLMLAALGLHILLRWQWDLPLWLHGLAAAALAIGALGAWRPRRDADAVVRSILACALLVTVCVEVPNHRIDFLPWLAILGVGYPLMIGLTWSIPVLVLAIAAYSTFGAEWFGWSGAAVRMVFTLLGGLLAGLIAEARVDANRAEEQSAADAESARVSARRLQAVIDAAPVGIMMIDRNYTPRMNAQVTEALGPYIEASRRGLDRIVHPEDRPEIERMINAVLHGQRTTGIVRAKHPMRDYPLTEVIAAPIFDDHQNVIDSVIILRNIQASVDAERELDRFRRLAETTSDIIGISSLNGDDHYLNPAGRRFFGGDSRSVGELVEFIPREYRRMVFTEAAAAIEKGDTWTGELELFDSNYRRRPMSAVILGVRDRSGELQAYAVSYRDIGERKLLEARLAHEAQHDMLTGLPNRQHLLNRLDELIGAGEQIAVLFCDLDGFKVVNDSLGHVAGDRLLQVVADRLRCSAREDDLVGRLAGDEFLIVCRNVASIEEVAVVAQRLLSVVSAPIRVNDRDHVVTLSIGFAVSEGPAFSAGELLQRADLAMYSSKQSGRGKVTLFDEDMQTRADERLNVERELRQALDGGELEVRYQPIVSLPDRAPLGFEALVRWRHPKRGLLSPSQFLGVAEDTGLAVQLGETVFAHACAAAGALRLQMPSLSMAVNLSAVQLADERLVDHVALAITRAGIVASAITIEITEEIAMSELEAARSKLDGLRSLGVRLAIDDFGTGHSNLALLRRLSADFVKIDRSLINGLGTEPGDTQLVRMILSLTQELGFAPVAEGVSTEVQLDELLRLGCRVAQGHLFAEPLTLAQAFNFISGWEDSHQSATH
jgi:diguanylate cyclase (GGDEF)-like protein/PAS domain S-box-containing protein